MSGERIVKRRVVDEAVRAVLATYVTGSYPIGLVDRPEVAASDPPETRYAIVFPIEGGSVHGPPLAGADADVTLVYYVRCVGKNRSQAQFVADDVRRVLLGRRPSGSGGFLFPLTFDEDPAEHAEMGRASADGIRGAVTVTAGVYQVTDSYEISVTRFA